MTNLHRTWDSEVYLISAQSREGLLAAGRRLESFLDTNRDIDGADLAFTLNCPDPGLGDARLAIVAASTAELKRKLARAMERLARPETTRIKERSGVYYFDSMLAREGQLAFVFPGEGAQYLNMLADLCIQFPEVRAWFDLIDRASNDQGRDYRPSDVVFPVNGTATIQEAEQRLWSMDCGNELVFAANQALLTLLSSLDIRPDAVVGHSSGEYSALIAAGCIKSGDPGQLVGQMIDLNAIYRQLRDSQQIPAANLAAVGAINETVLRATVEQSAGTVFIAMDNCPQQIVLCGSEVDLAPLIGRLNGLGAICVTLPFNRAYHTPLFGPFCEALGGFLDGLEIKPPTVEVYSCATAEVFPADPDAIRTLMARQWSSPVRFRETIEALYAAGIRAFVEVGPRGNLTSFVDNTLADRRHLAVPLNTPQRSGICQLNHAIGLLAAHGFDVQPAGLYKHRSPRRLDLSAVEPNRDSRGLQVQTSMPVLGRDALRSVASLATRAARTGREPASQSRTETTSSQPRAEAGIATEPTADAAAGVTEPGASAHAHSTGKHEVMQRYLETMERFVAVQGEVMCAYLTGSLQEPGSFTHARDEPRNVAPAGTAPTSPSAWSAPTASKPTPEIAKPATLGTSAAVEPNSTEQDASPPGGAKQRLADDHSHATALSPSDITGLLQRVISDRTGYPPEMIEPTLSLEADLGIDSIKRVEILGTLHIETNLIRDGDMEKAAALKTLAELATFLAENQAGTDDGPDPVAPPPLGPPTMTMEASKSASSDIGTPGKIVVVKRRIDGCNHLYLRDHTLGGTVSEADPALTALPLVPLTMSLEFMADAAATLAPDLALTAIETVTAHRWIAVDDGPVDLRIVARCEAEGPARRIAVKIWEVDGEERENGDPAIEGTLILSDHYPPAPVPRQLDTASVSATQTSALYDGAMFHGPAFQAVSAITRDGADSMEAVLAPPKEARFFASESAPHFRTDPVLVDSAGQVVGFWSMRHLERGFNVFPYRVEALRFYGPPLPAGSEATCRAHIRVLSESRLSADLDVLRADGTVYLRIDGWQDVRVDVPSRLQSFRMHPRTSLVSDPVDMLAEAPGVAVCLLSDLGKEALQAFGGICQLMLAHLVLTRAEREQWRAVGESQRAKWLRGRAAAKDAVRILVAGDQPPATYPADIEVSENGLGQPVVGSTWASAPSALHISISDSAGITVAAAADRRLWNGVGVGMELLADHQGDRDFAFSTAERALLDALDPLARGEWSLRLWCAKEAAAKAFGHGLINLSRRLEAVACEATSYDEASGDVWISVAAASSGLPDKPGLERVLVRTRRHDGDVVIAVALAGGGL